MHGSIYVHQFSFSIRESRIAKGKWIVILKPQDVLVLLYDYLVIVDAIRDGRARERELAIRELKMRFRQWL
jgi:predicted acyltransferase (DUF342 family)